MRTFEIVTEEKVNARYVIRAMSKEQAEQLFKAGVVDDPTVTESIEVDITEIKEV